MSAAVFEPLAATSFSFLTGASQPDEMVAAAKGLGLSGLGVADRNTVAGVVRAHVAAKAQGLRLIVGARLVDRDGLHVAIYPKDRAAWGRLCQTLTAGNRRSKKGDCDLTADDVLGAMEGACAILVPPAVIDAAWLEVARARLAAAPAGCDLFLATTRPFDGTDWARLMTLKALAATRRGVRLIAVMDALMHDGSRRLLADTLACIRNHVTLDEAGHLRLMNAERRLKPPAEVARLFRGWDDALAAQADLFAAVAFDLDQLRYEYPDEVVAPGETPQQSLVRLAEEGARGRWPEGIPPKVRAALDHEYALIEQLDYARYFLTVHDIVAFARSRGIVCQGRGSAANSVVCYCLGVTAVDPVRVDLLFERFISAERREPPDIDVDFEHERREEVIQHIYEKYGRDRAGIAGVVISYRGRSALREVGKAFGLTADTQEALAKAVWGWGRGGVDPALIQRMTGIDVTAPRIAATLELARELQGFPRHLSQHVGGFVITRGPLETVVPIGNAAMPDRTFVEWDKDDLDALGILKIDVLALGMLTCVARAFDFLKKDHGIDMGLADVPAEDPAVYDMICRADTVGVFQIESRAQMSMLPRLRPRTFYDLVIEVAIVRPGPIQGDMVHPYLRRRQGLETVTFPSKELEDVLGKTLGVPLFQEQAMRIAIVAAGFSPAEADRLRRAMATFRKVGIIHEFGMRLVEGMVERGYDREFAERCFRQIEGFGEYGFPESHAASFALIVYVSAWLKCHWPDVFLAAILNAQPMGFYASAQLVRDAKEHGVTVLPVDVGFSDWDNGLESCGPSPRKGERASARAPSVGFAATSPAAQGRTKEAPCPPPPAGEGDRAKRGGGGTLYEAEPSEETPLVRAMPDAKACFEVLRAHAAVKGRGCAASAKPIAPLDRSLRADGTDGPPSPRKAVRLGLREIKGFKEADAARIVAAREAGGPFRDAEDLKRRARLNARAMELLADADALESLTLDRRAALWRAKGLAEEALPLFAGLSEYGPEVDPGLPDMPLSEQVVHDYARLRLSLKAHPLAFYREELARRRFVTAVALRGLKTGTRVDLAGLVLLRQKPGTAKGVLFATLEDETGAANVIIWPKVFERFRRETLAARLMAVRGRLQNEAGVIHLIADRVEDWNHRLPELSDGTARLPAALSRADEIERPRETPQIRKRADEDDRAARTRAAFAHSRDFH
jgi:error-prone DNA polymerase